MPLSRERLYRLLDVLERQNGEETVRQLTRRFSIWRDEIEEAERLGWIDLDTRRPSIGRPSTFARLSKNQPAKLPPPRSQIEKAISHNHWKFAIFSVCSSVKGGGDRFAFPSYVDAYQRAYPSAKSRAGAHASCSRLLRNPNIFAARQWLYAKTNAEIPAIKTPTTETEIWEQLKEAGSWRARYAPTPTHRFRERAWY